VQKRITGVNVHGEWPVDSVYRTAVVGRSDSVDSRTWWHSDRHTRHSRARPATIHSSHSRRIDCTRLPPAAVSAVHPSSSSSSSSAAAAVWHFQCICYNKTIGTVGYNVRLSAVNSSRPWVKN